MIGLVVIAAATLIAAVQEVGKMIGAREVTLADLLLLFIYLEVLTMVSVYLQSGALPVRMPMYIAMVALARHLILDMKEMTEWSIVATSAGILVISLAVLAIRYGHVRFPYDSQPKGD
jgi:protein PsiE